MAGGAEEMHRVVLGTRVVFGAHRVVRTQPGFLVVREEGDWTNRTPLKTDCFLGRMPAAEMGDAGGWAMVGQPGFFDGDERLKALSAAGDPLERLAQVVDFEVFRGDLEAALSRSDRAKGGRPAYDAVLMFKVLVLQTLYTLSDDQTEYQLRDRWSFMRFVGLALHDPVPDAKTIWLFREQLARAGATERLFTRFDALLRAKGWLAKGGQIVDATVIAARRPRLTQAEKDILKGGGTPAEWKPARRTQVDRDGRWTIKRGKKRAPAPGAGHQRQIEIAVPVFGYKNHVGIRQTCSARPSPDRKSSPSTRLPPPILVQIRFFKG